jgi:hypothetical protein
MSLLFKLREKQIPFGRNNEGPHNALHQVGSRAKELRKDLFSNYQRIPGRKFKLFYLFSIFTAGLTHAKLREVRGIYG